MLNDIEDGKDEVSFVLVFKLSRFGRNAADILMELFSTHPDMLKRVKKLSELN